MRKVFWEDPYLTSLKTTVEAVHGNEILCSETIIFHNSGGQASDKATINGLNVLDSRMPKDEEGFPIYYFLPEDHGLKVGDVVEMRIDWPCRNRLMRLHFSCELVLVLFNRMFGKIPDDVEMLPDQIDNVGIVKTGANMHENGARVDFALDENISQYFAQIHAEFKKIVAQNRPIEKGYIDESKQLRYWRVEGIATVPCGGTHVRSTAEIGDVQLKRENAGNAKHPHSGKKVKSERVKITLVDPQPTSEPSR